MQCISIFKCNPQIEVIDKSHCSLEDVPNFQNYSRSLEELFLDANKLTVLNENVFRLTKLRRFSFSDNAIQDIPPDIAKLVNLVELDCSRNKIQTIPEQIKFLRGLQVCDFSANNIEQLPSGLVQLKNLVCLTLNYCPIQSLPDDFGLLKNLESLELRENELESLPASITNLESLKKLDIGINKIQNLPEDIGRLVNLEYLLVDGNRLETVPPKIGRLENLQCLDLAQQEYGLKYLPEEIGGLISLTDFHLSGNDLHSLPDGIRNLRNLTIFKVDNNYLTELNSNIGGCTSLQELILTSNQLSRLPSSISSLTDLRSLNADSNLIVELPPQIGNLVQLGILSLRDNFLNQLPYEIGQLEKLTVLDVSGNRLEYLPISMTTLNLRALWLSKSQIKPLPKLQIEEIPESRSRVLTCYLLPQSIDDNELSDQTKGADSATINYDMNREPAVTFDSAAIDDAELSNDVNFVRQDTPHPRELKARHQKLFNNTGKQELTGHDNASFSMVDNNNQQAYDRDYAPAEEVGIPPSSYKHLEYESNGLPEFPEPIKHSSMKAQFANQSYNKHEFQNDYEDDNYAHQEKKYSYENGINSNNRAKSQLTDRMQGGKSSNFDEKAESEQTGNSQCQVLDILVRRSIYHKPGLGLSIAGGKDTPPYKDNDEGIFVSKVTRGGPAEAAGVKVGDKILAVNNNIFYEGITHTKAVDIFKRLKPDSIEFTMKVLRDPNDEFVDQEDRVDEDYPVKADSAVTNTSKFVDKTSTNTTFARTYTIPVASETNGVSAVSNLRQQLMKEPEKVKPSAATLPSGMSLLDSPSNKNIIYTTLVKAYNYDLGLVLENRYDDDTRSNLVISRIKPNSIAARDGKLQVGDRLLKINGADVTGIDLERVMLMLEGTDRFIRIVVSRGDDDDPLDAALRNVPVRPPLGSWFSSTSNMSQRPSLIESYQRPTFGSVSSLQKQPQLLGTKPPKPPKPTHLLVKDEDSPIQPEDNPIARPRSRGAPGNQSMSDAERRAVWRQERLKSIEDDVEMAKLIAEAQRRRRKEDQ